MKNQRLHDFMLFSAQRSLLDPDAESRLKNKNVKKKSSASLTEPFDFGAFADKHQIVSLA